VIDSLSQGGAETVVKNIVERSNHTHTVCHLFPNKTLADPISAAGGTVVSLDQSFVYDPRAIMQLWNLLSGSEFDIIHGHLPYARTLARAISFFQRLPAVVSTYHNPPQAEKWSVAYVLDPLLGHVDSASIAVSKSVQREYESRAVGKAWQTIYNGIAVSEFASQVADSDTDSLRTKLEISTDTPVILAVGRYVPQKSHSSLIRAMPDILEVLPTAQLIIVGEGPMKSELREVVRTHGLSEHVQITGRIEDIHPYYKLADVFALASQFEGFGIVAVEAMAAGLPVVATRVDGLTEVVADGETGVLVSPSDKSELVSGLLRVLEGNTDSYGKAGRKRAEEVFGVESMVSSYDRLYSEFERQSR
jgi:glycosyltransferase involved in cell wall biosynthesis